MLDQANSTQERVQRIVGHWTIGVTLWGLGQHRTACTHLEQGVALYDHQEDRSLALSFGQDPGVTCLVFLGHAMWPLGYPERARQSFRDAVSLAREINHPFSLAFALSTEMAVNARLQDTQALLDGAGPLIALSTEHNFPLWMAWATSLRGWALTRTGKRAEGIALLDQGLAIIRMIGAEIEVPHLRSLQARAYGEAGLTDQGLKIVDDALNALAQGDNEDRSAEPELHRIRGELLLQLEQPNAEECFQTAIATARRQDAKLWELRATVSLCRLWQKHGKISEARAALSAIYGWFTEGFETVDLKVAKALLDELV
jgi:predicted ATPase